MHLSDGRNHKSVACLKQVKYGKNQNNTNAIKAEITVDIIGSSGA